MILISETYPGYGADDAGHIYSYWHRVPNTLSDWHIDLNRPKLLKPTHRIEKGRSQIRPHIYIKTKTKKRHKILVSRLVADAWLGYSSYIVRHLNDISTDNRPCNLVYGSTQVNIQDRQRNQLSDICVADYERLKQENIELKTLLHKYISL